MPSIFYDNITKGMVNGLCIWKLKYSSVIHINSKAVKVVRPSMLCEITMIWIKYKRMPRMFCIPVGIKEQTVLLLEHLDCRIEMLRK